MAASLAASLDDLLLVGSARSLNLGDALDGAPRLTSTIEGASTLELTMADAKRLLLRNPLLDERSWVRLGKVNYELVGHAKSGDRVNLMFEDAIVAALRRRKGKLSIKARTITRAEFMRRLAREARVPVVVDPEKRGKVNTPLTRSVGRDKQDSWEVSGQVAEDVRWRRFSNGRQLVVGSETWLLKRDKTVDQVREFVSGVSNIDYNLDTGRRASEATVTCEIAQWVSPPGNAVAVAGMGAADGRWLVAEVAQSIGEATGSVKLVRARHDLKEPPPEKTKKSGDKGDPDFLPDQGGSAGGGAASNSARERMVAFALAQNGDPYVWGASGPGSWDCSGLVQEATRAGGRVLNKPSASQWGTCVSAGKTIPVSTALRTRGALLFRIGGEYNHVAISLGNGSTIEARGSAYGTGVFGGASSGGWTGAALWL